MAGPGFVNVDQMKQQQQLLNMRGAQMAQQKTGQKTELGSQPKAKGTKKQLIGTIAGIAAVIVGLFILKALGLI